MGIYLWGDGGDGGDADGEDGCDGAGVVMKAIAPCGRACRSSILMRALGCVCHML